MAKSTGISAAKTMSIVAKVNELLNEPTNMMVKRNKKSSINIKSTFKSPI